MGMNPETNKFEPLSIDPKDKDVFAKSLSQSQNRSLLIRPDGSPVPVHWCVFQVGELVAIKNYTYADHCCEVVGADLHRAITNALNSGR